MVSVWRPIRDTHQRMLYQPRICVKLDSSMREKEIKLNVSGATELWRCGVEVMIHGSSMQSKYMWIRMNWDENHSNLYTDHWVESVDSSPWHTASCQGQAWTYSKLYKTLSSYQCAIVSYLIWLKVWKWVEKLCEVSSFVLMLPPRRLIKQSDLFMLDHCLTLDFLRHTDGMQAALSYSRLKVWSSLSRPGLIWHLRMLQLLRHWYITAEIHLFLVSSTGIAIIFDTHCLCEIWVGMLEDFCLKPLEISQSIKYPLYLFCS